jgi:hypothetical protein
MMKRRFLFVASYEKIVKYVVERFQQALAPLEKIIENQETIIRQNTLLQETVNKISQRGSVKTNEDLIIACSAEVSKKSEEEEFEETEESDDSGK